MSQKSLLIHCRHAPYGHSLSRTAIEFAMAAGAFDQPVALLFSGDGVWQLIKDQSPPTGQKNLGKFLSALPLYGLDCVYVESEALNARGLNKEHLLMDVKLINQVEIKGLYSQFDTLFNF